MYRFFYVLAFILCFAFNTVYAKKYKIQPGKALIFSIVSYALIFGWAYILAWIVNGFEWGHHNAIRVYIWFPVILLLTVRLFKLDYGKALEFITPSTCIVYGVARIGCLFPGCCYGFPANWGIYSVSAGYRCFPVQLCEALTALAIAAFIISLAKRKHFQVEKCNLYPIMLTLYGGTRFLWEFAADNKKVLFNHISELAIWAFATLVIGIVWLIVIRRKNSQT